MTDSRLKRIVWRVLRIKVGIPISLCLLCFFSMIIWILLTGFYEKSGVASDAETLMADLAEVTKGRSAIDAVLRNGDFIPFADEVIWEVEMGPRGGMVYIHGTSNFDFNTTELGCICCAEQLWDENCSCFSRGKSRYMANFRPEWGKRFRQVRDEEAIAVIQVIGSDDKAQQRIRYAVSLESGTFFTQCECPYPTRSGGL